MKEIVEKGLQLTKTSNLHVMQGVVELQLNEI
jgi:hypothetical protein